MKLFSIICGAFLISSFHLSLAVAQKGIPPQQSAPVLPTKEIVLGQPLAEVKAILEQYKMEFGESWFEFNRIGEGADEIKHIGCKLDPEHSAAAIFYHVGTEQIKSISVEFSPSPKTGKSYRTWVSVRKITLHPDGSYSLHFEKPIPPKPAIKPVGERTPFGPIPTGPVGGKSDY